MLFPETQTERLSSDGRGGGWSPTRLKADTETDNHSQSHCQFMEATDNAFGLWGEAPVENPSHACPVPCWARICRLSTIDSRAAESEIKGFT